MIKLYYDKVPKIKPFHNNKVIINMKYRTFSY